MTVPAPNVGEYNNKKRVYLIQGRVLASSSAFASSSKSPDHRKSSFSITTAHKNPAAELKNGKVVFRQKSVSFDKALETMQGELDA